MNNPEYEALRAMLNELKDGKTTVGPAMRHVLSLCEDERRDERSKVLTRIRSRLSKQHTIVDALAAAERMRLRL